MEQVAAKLTDIDRAEIVDVVAKRNALAREIARLQYERSLLPRVADLVKKHNVCHQTIRRAVLSHVHSR
jgi:chorismate mutase